MLEGTTVIAEGFSTAVRDAPLTSFVAQEKAGTWGDSALHCEKNRGPVRGYRAAIGRGNAGDKIAGATG